MSYDYIHIVNFKKWCPKCKYHNVIETDDPCNECLEHGANEATDKPVLYQENDDEN